MVKLTIKRPNFYGKTYHLNIDNSIGGQYVSDKQANVLSWFTAQRFITIVRLVKEVLILQSRTCQD